MMKQIIYFILLAVLFSSCRETVRTADHYYEVKDYDRASVEYREFIKNNPDLPSVPNAYLGLAWSEFKLEHYPEAEGAVAILLSRFPGHYLEPQVRYLKAHILFAQRKYVECTEELEDFIFKYPDNSLIPDVRILLARSTAFQLRYTEAAEQYKVYLDRYGNGPYVPAALIGRAEALEKSAKWKEAAETLQEFVNRFKKHPERPAAMLNLARYKMAFGDYNGAEPILEEIIHGYSDPELTLKSQQMLIDLYDALRKKDEAAQAAKNLLSLISPRDVVNAAPLNFRLAQYYAEKGDTELARTYFRIIADKFESDSMRHSYALYWLTIDELSRGNREEALTYGNRFLSIYTNHPDIDKVERLIIDVYIETGRKRDGASMLETNFKRRWMTVSPAEFYRLASVFIELSEYSSAEKYASEGLKRARAVSDTRSILSGLYHLMILYNMSDKTGKAIENWWELKRLSPDYLTVSEKVFWDQKEEAFYEENKIPLELRKNRSVSEYKQKIHSAGFDWQYGDIESMKLSNALSMTIASAVETSQDMTYISKKSTKFVDDIIKMQTFNIIPDSFYPLRSSIGADWIIHGRIRTIEDKVRLDLRLLRISYNEIFPFEYRYDISEEDLAVAASRIVRENLERCRLYRSE